MPRDFWKIIRPAKGEISAQMIAGFSPPDRVGKVDAFTLFECPVRVTSSVRPFYLAGDVPETV
jgi:hypothetical protein